MTYVIHIEIKADLADAAESVLEEMDLTVVLYQENGAAGSLVTLDVYFESLEDAQARLPDIEQNLREVAGEAIAAELVTLEEHDWSEKWKEFYHTERVTPRIVIKPSWESVDARCGDCVIELDPGMSFGTGQHPTTRGCLSFIDLLAERMTGKAFLDVGCGSAVLSIAAAKLGLSPVCAIDCDPVAIEAAQANLALNGVSELASCKLTEADGFSYESKYHLVVANMLTPILEKLVIPITTAVSDDEEARLILSGIAVDQYRRVLALYGEYGFVEVQSMTEGTWQTGLFRHG